MCVAHFVTEPGLIVPCCCALIVEDVTARGTLTHAYTHTHTHTHTHNAIRATRKIKTDGGAKGRGQPRENVCYENEVEAAMPREMFSTYRRVSGSWCG